MNELPSTILNDTDIKCLRPELPEVPEPGFPEWTDIPEVKSGSETWSCITESVSNGRSFESLKQEVDKILNTKTIENFEKVFEEMGYTDLPKQTQDQSECLEYSKADNGSRFSEGSENTKKTELSSEKKLKIKEETGSSDGFQQSSKCETSKNAPELSNTKGENKSEGVDSNRTKESESAPDDGENETDSTKGGGAYKDLPSVEGHEKHHMPAKSASDVSEADGPAIVMEKEDHRKTASCGNSRDAQEYRAEQKRLIDEGKYKEAQRMDIDDIREKFGDKYDDQIKEMEEYTDKLMESKKELNCGN